MQSLHAPRPKSHAAKTSTCRGSWCSFWNVSCIVGPHRKTNLTNWWPQMYSILLVDDEPQILAAWSLILVNEGYRVTCANNGVEALECLKHHVPDLIVTDWIMPLMDGLSLCREIRAQPGLAHIPILGHSAAAPPDVLQPDWILCLKKPVAVSLFLTTVSNLCKRAI
jgi:CheY-like chemotaxis protein